MTKANLLTGAAALAAIGAVFGGSAQAAPVKLFGGGSTLIGPYLRQVGDCWGNGEDLVVQGSANKSTSTFDPKTGAPEYYATGESFITEPYFVYSSGGSTVRDCSVGPVNANYSVYYLNSGSGNGELGLITKDISLAAGTTTDGGTAGHGARVQFTGIQYGMGDYALGGSEVAAYTNGGALSQKDANSAVITIRTQTDATQTDAWPTYANPYLKYGNFIQVPVSIDPVAIAFPLTYGQTFDSSGSVTHTYHLNIKAKNADGSGGLHLDVGAVCAIFNGQITNLNDKALLALNGGQSLKDPSDPNPFNVPIEIVGRADSSGTTSIFYRALAAQCGQGTVTYKVGGDNITYTNAYLPAGGKKLPGANGEPINLIGPGGVATPGSGQFTTQSGNTAVAAYVSAPIPVTNSSTVYQFRITYVGTDYALPYSTNNGLTYNLSVANIRPNGKTAFIQPTVAFALRAFGTGSYALVPPQSNSAGAYSAGVTASGLRSHAEDWAEPITTTLSYEGGTAVSTPLADPNANVLAGNTTLAAYPFVGTTNVFLNTCYTGPHLTGLQGLFKYYYLNPLVNDGANGLLAKAGLAPLPAAWRTAIVQTFFAPVSATAPLNLNIALQNSGKKGSTGGQCAGITPGA